MLTKKFLSYIFIMILGKCLMAQNPSYYNEPVRPGTPGSVPFWNNYSKRFMYAPAFDVAATTGAASYRFVITDINGKNETFTAPEPWAALTPVWSSIPEGYTTLTIEALDKGGNKIAVAAERTFYRSAGFTGIKDGRTSKNYFESGRECLKALYNNPSVQYWLSHKSPDPKYSHYGFPSKVIGGVVRAMVKYHEVAETQAERDNALKMAANAADYLLSIRYAEPAGYAGMIPTYAINSDKPIAVAAKRSGLKYFMVTSCVDAAFGLLDLYDATHEQKYLDACKKMADILLKKQNAEGTWPHMVNAETGQSVHDQLLIPTWIIFLFDRLEHQYHLTQYKASRQQAWNWIVNNPLKTYRWDGQFEDVQLVGPYQDLAREQACDVASLLLDKAGKNEAILTKVDDLLRFAEDQFVVWAPMTDVKGWVKIMPPKPQRHPETWFAPTVLEQYVCYEPVARSSAILINVYLKAYKVTGKHLYFEKAKALGNGLLYGQEWVASQAGKNDVEIPTWVKHMKPSNWLNNSYYAAEAVLNLSVSTK